MNVIFDPICLFNLRSEEWHQTVKNVADFLLEDYFHHHSTGNPIDVEKLAKQHGIKINLLSSYLDEGRLIPSYDGFVVLATKDSGIKRYRSCIAHEIAHTVFYKRDCEIPSRIVPWSEKEEQFCFDVARHLLAPEKLIKELKISLIKDPEKLFFELIDKLQISSDIAGRVIFDYQLLNGVYGFYTKRNKSWNLKKGKSFASKVLNRKDRETLRSVCKRWLEKKPNSNYDYKVFGKMDTYNINAFVVAVFSDTHE